MFPVSHFNRWTGDIGTGTGTPVDKSSLNGLFNERIKSGLAEFELPFLGRTDLTAISIPVLAIVLGLIDGFNPCAMWVLVYLISLILSVNDRKKIWLIVGSFVFASGVLYFLFMTAWLNAFLLIGYFRPLTIIIGLGVKLAAFHALMWHLFSPF